MNSDTTTDRRAGVPGVPGWPGEAEARRPARPRRRPRPGWPADLPKSPVRPASPIRPPGPGRSGRPVKNAGTAAQVRQGPATAPASAAHQPATAQRSQAARQKVPGGKTAHAPVAHAGAIRRTSFVLLLLGLLGGGLVCLLAVNTTLAANSFEIENLQQQNTAGAQRVQQLEQQVALAQTATVIAREAKKLGMRPESRLTFVDLRSSKILDQPGTTARELAGLRIPASTAGNGKHAGRHDGSDRRAREDSAIRLAAARGAGQ